MAKRKLNETGLNELLNDTESNFDSDEPLADRNQLRENRNSDDSLMRMKKSRSCCCT